MVIIIIEGENGLWTKEDLEAHAGEAAVPFRREEESGGEVAAATGAKAAQIEAGCTRGSLFKIFKTGEDTGGRIEVREDAAVSGLRTATTSLSRNVRSSTRKETTSKT